MSSRIQNALNLLRRPPAFDAEWKAVEKGAWGEAHAARYFFHQKGAAILVRNWRAHGGELDLIVRHDETLVFVEVKTRDPRDPEPLAAVRDEKRTNRLQRTAAAYYRELDYPRPPYRFDIVVVTPDMEEPTKPQIDHLKDVYTVDLIMG
jgi:putative endonuclease